MLTGQIVRPSDSDMHDPRGVIARIAGRLGEPVLRTAFRQAMRIMGHQFVMGRTIEEALERSVSGDNRAYRYSFDMLGEAALTDVDGRLVPNLELGHHPLRKNATYEDLVNGKELRRVGKKRWRGRVDLIIDTLGRIFNYDTLHIGGGNARHLKGPFPDSVRLFESTEGLIGGIRLWPGGRRGPR
jgi:hypothetical protein